MDRLGRGKLLLMAALATALLSSCARVSSAEEEPADATAAPLTCPIEPRNDGKFTGWPLTTACSEWPTEPTKGTYGNLYMTYTVGGTLRILNDWHLCTEKPPKDFYNLFQLTTGDGTQHWMTRVMGTKVHVWLNGKKIGAFSRGAAGFGASPTKEQDHTIYEFSLPDVAPGKIAMKMGDPGGPPFSSPEESIVMDPKGYSGVLQQGGGAVVEAIDGPLLVAVEPAVITKAQLVELVGFDLGAPQGTVTVDGTAVKIDSWSATSATIHAPALANGNYPIALTTKDGKAANLVKLQVKCDAACGTKVCGDDGCGGSCGACGAGQMCKGGQCKCAPSCVDKVCGDDGCGGSCGGCPSGEQCDFGKCACAPSCGSNVCGDDGCGGSCGGCQGTLAKCVSGQCACTKDCAGKQCGDDGCSGQCGTCDAGESCVADQCSVK